MIQTDFLTEKEVEEIATRKIVSYLNQIDIDCICRGKIYCIPSNKEIGNARTIKSFSQSKTRHEKPKEKWVQ